MIRVCVVLVKLGMLLNNPPVLVPRISCNPLIPEDEVR